MNDEIGGILRELLVRYGTELANDRRRLEGLLLDRYAGGRKEIGLLVMAAKESVAEELAALPGGRVEAPLYSRLIGRLCQDVGIDESNARWAVETWAEALGKELPPLPPPSSGPAAVAPTGVVQASAPTGAMQAPAPTGLAASALGGSAGRAGRLAVVAGIPLAVAAIVAAAWLWGGRSTALTASETNGSPETSPPASASAVATATISPTATSSPSADVQKAGTGSEPDAATMEAKEEKEEEPMLFPFYRDPQGGGYIDRAGKVVVEPQYDSVSAFSDGMAVVSLNGKEGYIDSTGTLVIPLQYESAFPFSEGLARVMVKNRYVYIDKSGQVVIDADIGDQAVGDAYFLEGLLPVTMDGLVGYVDRTGAVAIPAQFDYAEEFHDGLALAQKGDERFYIDKTGAVVIPNNPAYYYPGDFSEGFSEIEKGAQQYGFIDESGSVAIPPDLEYASSFSEGLAAAESGGKFGFIDSSGNWVIPPQFAYASAFHDGMAVIRNDRFEWGYVNRQGEIVVPYSLHSASDFQGGLAWIEKDEEGEGAYIDTGGNVVWSPELDAAAQAKEEASAAIDAGQIADRSRYHDSLRGADGKTYDLYLYAEDEDRSVTEDPWGGANVGDILYSGHYKAAIGQNGKLHVRMLSDDGEEPLSFNASRKMIGKLASAGGDVPDVLYIAQYGSSNGDIYTFYLIDDGQIVPLTLRFDEKSTSPDLFVSALKALDTPGQYETRAYDNSVGEWIAITWKLDVLHRELIQAKQERSPLAD